MQALLAGYVGKPISFKKLQEALGTINTFYISRGYFLARAILPAQDLPDGIVRIAIVEGNLGDVIIQGNKFYKTDFIRSHFACEFKGVINYHRLLKSLLLLNSYPDLSVKAVMQKGKLPYSVDLVLTVEDKRPLHFSMDYNNFGSRFVSRNMTGLGMEYSNLFLGGDKITLRETNGWSVKNLKYGSIGYAAPVHASGTTVGVSYAQSEFDVQKEFRKLDAHGESNTISLELNQPLKRSFTGSLDASVGFDAKHAKNYLLGAISTEDKLRILRAGVSGDRLDTVFRGRDFMNVTLSQGLSTMGASKKNDSKASRIGAGGEFTKANIDLARYQQLPWNNILMVKLTSQFTDDILPVSEQFAIGGANTVRGYPQAEHLGDYGEVVNVEVSRPMDLYGEHPFPFVHKNVKDVVRIAGFFDYGQTHLKNPQVGEKKSHSIAGAGAGLRFDFGQNLNAKLDVGFPVSGDKSSDGDDAVAYLQVFKKF